MSGISIREFARRDGCSEGAVRKAIKTGHLKKLADGKLDETLVGSGWRASNRKTRSLVQPVSAPDDVSAETPEQGALRALEEVDVIPPQAESEAAKEFYISQLRRLEFDLKRGLVAPVEEMGAIFGAKLARVRSRLLAFPSEIAPEIQRCKTTAEAEALIRKRVVEVLDELSEDRGTS